MSIIFFNKDVFLIFLMTCRQKSFIMNLMNWILTKYTVKKFLLIFFATATRLWAQERNSGPSVITIVNANKTSYEKDSVTKEEQIVLTGAVVVEVTQGASRTKISASRISYNRETNILYAQGDVVMEQTGGSAGEQKISAQTVLFNTVTYEGIFDGGRVVQTQSDAINLPSGSTLIVSSSMFGKNSENTIVFKNASLTFCDDENPHWKIRATKIWVLPGGEFAFFNALLFVGEIPVMYLPGFYYPKDELIFNPTFGYDTRRGYYFQTTTYIFGRKPLEDSSAKSDDEKDEELGKGLYNFMKPTKLKEQRREGIVLHNLDEDYTGDTSNYFKLMFDYYSTLGTMVGFDTVFKPKKYLSTFNANLNLGFSNTVFLDPVDNIYMPFSSTGESYKDGANLLGIKTPFRYSGNLSLSGNSPFNFKVSMPLYSDPYFVDDFGERTEYMDWISFLTHGAKDGDEDEENDDSVSVSSYTWNATASYSFNIPDFMKPYVQTLAITDISSSIIFNSKTNTAISNGANDNWYLYTPERMFFYPSQVTPLKFSASVSGSLFKYPQAIKTDKSVSFPYSLSVPDEFADKKKTEQDAGSATGDNEKDLKEKQGVLNEKDLPLLDVKSDIGFTDIKDLEWELNYSLSPQFTSQFAYDSTKLSTPDDFKWSERKSTYYQLTSPFVLSSNLSFRDSMLGMKNVFTFTPLYQTHPNLDGYSDSDAALVRKTDYQARKNDLDVENDVSVKPLIYNDVLKKSKLN